MKGLVLKLGAFTALFWRNLAGIGVSGVVYAWRRQPLPSAQAFRIHLIRGCLSAVMAFAFFWGLARIPIAQAVAITFVAPLLSIFLSAALLHERLSTKTLSASLIAFAGVVVILLGQWQASLGESGFLGTGAVFFSALCYAFNIVLMRKQALVSGPVEVAFWQSVIVTAVTGLGAPFFATLVPLAQVPLIVLAATLAVVSLALLAWAYARGEASYLSTSEYTAFLWACGFGWLLFAERVSVATLIGAAMIVGGCLLAAHRGDPPLESAT
jgi:S-adenosylmethionine uptake transporter